ncbi:hypothetical protein, partial [Anaerobiospirillum succiniciproducens]|uniref:hypothetical protein n=1 Tax=Anaerobiospirillum succiniciproducens TaxID=13335 RepID=UPI002941E3B4
MSNKLMYFSCPASSGTFPAELGQALFLTQKNVYLSPPNKQQALTDCSSYGQKIGLYFIKNTIYFL